MMGQMFVSSENYVHTVYYTLTFNVKIFIYNKISMCIVPCLSGCTYSENASKIITCIFYVNCTFFRNRQNI